jgi:flagellar basal body rod protein FlgG
MSSPYNKPTNESVFSGMEETTKRLSLIIKHNVKNSQTVGFKSVFTNSILLDPETKNLYRDDDAGVMIDTPHSPLNLAIDKSNAFFLVEGKNGPERTRDGKFHLNAQGEIVNAQGQQLVVLNRPDTEEAREAIRNVEQVTISNNGDIRVKDQYLGKIALEYENRQPGDYAQIHQGRLESSNVDMDDNILKIVELKRHYETLQNMMAMNLSVEKALVDTYGRNV